jgi:bacillopeptidase F
MLVGAIAAAACAGREAPVRSPSVLPDPPRVVARVPEPAEKFEEGFHARLTESPPGNRVRAVIDLSEQLDLRAWSTALRAAGLGKAERRAAVVSALETVARDQQDRLHAEIERLKEGREIDYVREVAIVNRLLVEGSASAILELARSSEVARILPDWTSEHRSGRTPPAVTPTALDDAFESWAISAMGVEELWARGIDGSGIVVATIDTGVYGEHEQLRDRMLPAGRGWYDPVEGSPTPHDSHGHGTEVLSVAVGANPRGRIVGVAPGARWASALGNWKNFYSRFRMTEAADWVLRVARPDVLINAWSDDQSECSAFDLPFIDAWKAAEIFVVFPAGNAGPDPATGEAPASLSGTFPDDEPVFSVAALVRGGDVFPSSSRGPSRCGSPVFPSLGAPGDDLPSAAIGGPSAYTMGSGTSLAAGLVGGAAALVLQAHPELGPHELEELFRQTARTLPSLPASEAVGAGGIDVSAALRRLRDRDGGVGPRVAP